MKYPYCLFCVLHLHWAPIIFGADDVGLSLPSGIYIMFFMCADAYSSSNFRHKIHKHKNMNFVLCEHTACIIFLLLLILKISKSISQKIEKVDLCQPELEIS